jgi:hypothetical protein
MLLLDLSPAPSFDPEADQQDSYPDEVMQSEWNPILKEIHSLLDDHQETGGPRPESMADSGLRKQR